MRLTPIALVLFIATAVSGVTIENLHRHIARHENDIRKNLAKIEATSDVDVRANLERQNAFKKDIIAEKLAEIKKLAYAEAISTNSGPIEGDSLKEIDRHKEAIAINKVIIDAQADADSKHLPYKHRAIMYRAEARCKVHKEHLCAHYKKLGITPDPDLVPSPPPGSPTTTQSEPVGDTASGPPGSNLGFPPSGSGSQQGLDGQPPKTEAGTRKRKDGTKQTGSKKKKT